MMRQGGRHAKPNRSGTHKPVFAVCAILHKLYETVSTRTGETTYTAVCEDRTATVFRASPTCEGAAAHTTQAQPGTALVIALALLACGLGLRRGLCNTRNGGQRATYEGSTHQLECSTSREAALGQLCSQLVEGERSLASGDIVYPFPQRARLGD
jgi:hypothetical protein